MNNKQKNKEKLQKLEFLLLCKEKEFHEAGYLDVSYHIIGDYLVEMKWKNRFLFFHEMAADLKKLSHSEVMDYLRLENIFHAKEESLHQIFNNLV